MRLLIVEDDPKLCRTLVQGLKEAGHDCHWAQDGDHALKLAKQEELDAVILDILLPARNGLEVLRRLRADGCKVPVLMVTALGYAGQVVTRTMLCEHLWDADWEGETNIIDVHINHLRAKIDKTPQASVIATVRGRGYRLLEKQ